MEPLSEGRPATLIVGVSGDLLEVARVLGRQGERVALLSSDGATLQLYKERLLNWGVVSETFHVNVTSPESVLAAFTSLVSWTSRLDRLIYNVSVVSNERATDLTGPELERVMGANFFGFVNCFQLALPMFKRSGGGHVITLTNSASEVEAQTQIAYAASSASLKIYVNALRAEFAERGLRFTEIGLGVKLVNGTIQELTCEEVVAGILDAVQKRPDKLLIGIGP